MNVSQIAAISFRLPNESCAKMYLSGTFDQIDWNAPCVCSIQKTCFASLSNFCTYPYRKGVVQTPAIYIGQLASGDKVLRIVETNRYIVKVENTQENIGCQNSLLPHLYNENKQFLKVEYDELTAVFQFINYLGRSKISFGNADSEKKPFLWFEVVPNKFSYEDDYVELTKAIAEQCAQLLLNYSGSTFSQFRQSKGLEGSLFEQFIFLRQFCHSENIRGLFEAIKRNPDSRLLTQECFQPMCLSKASHKFFTNPIASGKKWQLCHSSTGKKIAIPQEVLTTKKEETLDTPANRFVFYAFRRFLDICSRLIAILQSKNASQAECLREAKYFRDTLEEILEDNFFSDVGRLQFIPQNNQVLQKREGYSQVLSAFSMLDMALQLDWEGEKNIYNGEAKNVALLYEYWLFFELHSIISSIEGCVSEKSPTEKGRFLQIEDGGLTLNLKSGITSCQCFEIPRLQAKVNLYYNRTFSSTQFRHTQYQGSYSRDFRPDFTLAVFPIVYNGGRNNGEDSAVKDGAVSYIHFDAKYRISDITSHFGNGQLVETDKSEDDDLFQTSKTDSVVRIYKDGDLLKMHAYRDAIRRTVGSYVLYPGENVENKRFQLYEEILPGVGAFSIKPSNREAGRKELASFLLDVIRENQHKSSRHSRAEFYLEGVISEPPLGSLPMDYEGSYLKNGKTGAACILGQPPKSESSDYFGFLKEKNLLSKGMSFYYHVPLVCRGSVFSHHIALTKAKYFRFVDSQTSSEYRLNPSVCYVKKITLLSQTDVAKCYERIGYREFTDLPNGLYFLLELQVIGTDSNTKLSRNFVDEENGNNAFSPKTPKVVYLEIQLSNLKQCPNLA